MIRNILKNLKLILVVFVMQKFKIFIKKTQLLHFWPEKNCVFLLLYNKMRKTVRLSDEFIPQIVPTTKFIFTP